MNDEDAMALWLALKQVLVPARRWVSADPDRAAAVEALAAWLVNTAEPAAAEGARAEAAADVDDAAVADGAGSVAEPDAATPAALQEVTLGLAGSTATVTVPAASGPPDAAEAETERRPSSAAVYEGDASRPDRAGAGRDRAEQEPFDPEAAALRLRLKADAIRWRIERERMVAEGVDFQAEVRPREIEWRERVAEAPGQPWVWAISANLRVPPDETMHRLAKLYDALADAVEFVSSMLSASTPLEDHPPLAPALHLLAEIQSALRVELDRSIDKWDADQQDVYYWLRHLTAEQQIYINRFMRMDDPADPGAAGSMRDRLAELRGSWDRAASDRKQRHERLGKLRYHAKRLRSARGEGDADDWEALLEAVDDIVESKDEQPSSKVMRKHLLPLVDRLPEGVEVPAAAGLVLREVRRYQRSQANSSEPDQSPPTEEAPPQVTEVREMLRGKVVVLIGGEERAYTAEALREAFELKELRWVSTRVHQSVEPIRVAAGRGDVDLVLLGIRWSSHAFGEVRSTCVDAGVPLVRLPAGLNPGQVAHQVLEQASGALLAEGPG